MLAVCLSSKQNTGELLEESLFTTGSRIYWDKHTPRSHYFEVNNELGVTFFPVNNGWEYFFRGVLNYCNTVQTF